MNTNEKGQLKICKNGHRFYKKTDCPTCPKCEEANKPNDGFLLKLAAPARRALQSKGINKLEELSKYTEKEILQLHGIGKTAIPILKSELKNSGLEFRKV